MTSEFPNVVLVTVDSLAAGHCGWYGYDRDTTPTLDAMAADGVAFRRAITPGPSTPESMPAIFTGDWPVPSGHSDDDSLSAQRARIRTHMAARTTVPERLQRAGYTTGGFTPNPFTSRYFGFDQGFDTFRDFMSPSVRGPVSRSAFDGFLAENKLSSVVRIVLNAWHREEVFKPWESFYDELVAWTRRAPEPYFLWVLLMDAHNPYSTPSKYRSQHWTEELYANIEFWRGDHETPFSDAVHERLVTAYDDAVRYVDAFLERLRTDLADDDPRIVVHGDHGEAFGEHGSYGHEPYLYEENVHVPLVVDGVEPAEVSEPFSLRSMPELLSGLVLGGSECPATGPYASTRTRRGGQWAVYGPRSRFIYDCTTWTAVDSTTDVPTEVWQTLLAQTTTTAERRQIATAADDLFGQVPL